MSQKPEGSFRLFTVAGITVYLHFIWLLVAYWQIVESSNEYSTIVWNIWEYLSLFGIVLLHEFGHAFATRQVGGSADTILLWPFGGIAYVSAPARPGAELWSIAAGPLVNVVLAIPLAGLLWMNDTSFSYPVGPNLDHFLQKLWLINKWLLLFNILPIYPLDGGQILRSLLWFAFGPIRSLLYATIVGFVGVAGLALYALDKRSIWMGVLTFYVFTNCRRAYLHARVANGPTRPQPI